jgi:hypothetical protein
LWTIKERPKLGEDAMRSVQQVFDQDLAKLGEKMGVVLSCENWAGVLQSRERLDWV